MSSVNLFNTGKSALFTSRAAISTTGHNIANVNTEGYSRQRVAQAANEPQVIGNVVYGSGVKLTGIHRINDDYLNKQITNEIKFKGQYEEKDVALGQAENVFNEINNEGMNRLMTKFFNEFRKLANEPESEAIRFTIRENTNQLIGDFHRISRSIRDIQKNIDVRIESYVRDINNYAKQIADLNELIQKSELNAQGQAPDLNDRRDLALKQLGTIVDIGISTNEKGHLTVAIRGAGPLVSGNKANKLYTETAKANLETGLPEGGRQLFLQNMIPPNVTRGLNNGRLGGLLAARDVSLGTALNRLDELAYTFSGSVNEIHRLGYSINGTTGVDFFKQPAKVLGAAELIGLSAPIINDANNIASALEPDAPGDNRIVQAIATMQHEKLMSGGVTTFDDFYNSTVAELAIETQKNKQILDHQDHILTQLDKLRESISGVSLDEETTNLIQFQHAFGAAAKMIQVADHMLEEILNLRR